MQLIALQGRGQREGILRVVAAGQLRVGEWLHCPVRDILRGLQRRAEAVPQEFCALVHGVPQEIGLTAMDNDAAVPWGAGRAARLL